MGKYALTIPRIAENIKLFNNDNFKLKLGMYFDEKYLYLLDKTNNEVLFHCKHEYVEEMLLAMHFLRICGYYCKFGCEHLIRSKYYKSRAKHPAHKHVQLWKTSFEKLNLL